MKASCARSGVAVRRRATPAADRHEQQADRAAKGFVRGTPGLRRWLTPATPSGFVLPGSAGEPLPFALRLELEGAFDADLAAVRVHRDAVAAEHVRRQRARAFAAGASVYFAAGRFDPVGADGRALIAHEIAHVLQQTGRANADGGWRATGAVGSGDIQCDDDPHADAKIDWLSSGQTALTQLADRHLARTDADDALKQLVAKIRQDATNGELPRAQASTIGTALIAIAEAGRFTIQINGTDENVALTAQAKGFLVDCLKVCGTDEHFEAAASLIDLDQRFEMMTSFGPRTDFRAYLKTHWGEDWIAGAFDHPSLKTIWKQTFMNTFRQYVFAPGRPRQTLYGFADAKTKALANLNAGTRDLMFNDRVLMAYDLLWDYDLFRMMIFQKLDESFEKDGIQNDMPTQRMQASLRISHVLMSLVSPAYSQTRIGMLKQMQSIAADAARFWTRIEAMRAEYAAAISGMGHGALTGLGPSLKRFFAAGSTTFDPLRSLLLGMSAPGGMYALDAAGALDMPAAKDYEKRVNALADALGLKGNPVGNVLLTLQMKLVAMHTADAASLDTDEATAIGLAIWWLFDLKPTLVGYKAAEDKDAKNGFTDARMMHRLGVALSVMRIAQIAGWADLLPPTARIVSGDDAPTSYLLTKGWTVDHDAGVERMVTDFNNQKLFDEYPFTADNIVRFFHADMLMKMYVAITAETDRVRTSGDRLKVEDINEAVRTAGRPWKLLPIDPILILKASELAPGPPDAKGAPTQNPKYPSVFKILSDSMKGTTRTRTGKDIAELAGTLKIGPGWYYTALRDAVQPVFVWIFPNIKRLIGHLRGIEPFFSFSTREGLDALDDGPWMLKIIEKMGAAATGSAANQAIVEYEKAMQVDVPAAMREFTVLHRRQETGRLAKLLKKYAGDRTVVNFEVPRKVVDGVDWFRVAVRPEADAAAQTALLILALAPDLDAAFDSARHAVRIPPLFHYSLTEAVKFADNELASAVAGDKVFSRELRPLLYEETPGTPAAADETYAQFHRNRDTIAALALRLEEARKLIQEELGFTSDDGQTLKSLGYYPRIKPGRSQAFEMDGDEWELVQVHAKFVYHPPLEMSAVTDASSKPVFEKNGRKVPPTDKVLLSFFRNGIEHDVRENDVETLNKLSGRLADLAFSREMENLAEGMEAGAMFMIDVIELIPGAGQKLMLARLAAQTAAFLAVELPTIADALKKDPVAYIKDIGAKLASEHLTLDNFVRFVVLGSDGIQAPFDSIRKPRPEAAYKKKPHGKLGRMIAMLRKLGMRLAEVFQWLKVRVQGPMRALQSAVATRPQLGWVLRKAIDIGLWVRDMVPPGLVQDAAEKQERLVGVLQDLLPGNAELPGDAPTPGGAAAPPAGERETHARGLIGRVEDQVRIAGDDFKLKLDEKLEVLREAELPAEVVPLPMITAFIIDFFLARLGAKVRIAKSLLENTGPYQDLKAKVAEALADAARGTAVDPNEYWRDLVLTKIDAQFADARNQLIDGIYGLSDRVADESGIAAFRLARPDKKQDFAPKRVPFPAEELELSPTIEGEVPAIGSLADLPDSAGQPLAVRVRLAEESRFGHDFGHVRLHQGEETRDSLGSMRADAATAGSHVFLRPGLSADQGEGARLLRHELTHVLQQVGPRPLGDAHEARPVRGARGGLLIDDMREAAAETMAKADDAVAREPVDVARGAEGVQPSLESTAVDMLKMLTELGGIEPAAAMTLDTKDKATQVGNSVWHAVRKRLAGQAAGDFLPFAFPVAAHIAKHIESIDLGLYFKAIGAFAQKPLKGARGKKPKTELDFDRFITLMEALIFRKTGIGMQLKVKEASPSYLVDQVKVTYVHLGWIAPGTVGKQPLWDEAMKTKDLLAGGDDPQATRLELHARLAVMGPDPFIWKTGRSEYRLSEDFVEAFAKYRASRKPDLVKKLPGKGAAPHESDPVAFRNEYLNPTSQAGIGLRIGLHGGHSGLEKQAGMDRESHHTTQYLLVQFFRNDNKIKAWSAGKAYAGSGTKGIYPRSGASRQYFEGDTKPQIKLDALDLGGAGKRGSAMPAILISADAHRRAQLHVEKEGQWKGMEGDPDSDESQGRITQGYAIQAQWKKQQATHVGTHEDAPDWDAKMKMPGAADKLHEAMIGVYHWMHGIMLPALERGLKTRELAYYRAVASRIPGAADPATGRLQAKYDLTPSDMHAVFMRAKRNNNDVMTAAGWRAP